MLSGKGEEEGMRGGATGRREGSEWKRGGGRMIKNRDERRK